MTERTRKQYEAQMVELSTAAFADHIGATKARAKDIGIDGAALGWHAGRVYIRRPGTSFYATEVVWLRHGRLLVHGDIAPVMFAARDLTFREAVYSLALSHISYVAGKVSEAERDVGSSYECDRDVLLHELNTELRNPDETEGALMEAIVMVEKDGDLDGAKRRLCEAGWDETHHLGRVVSPRVYYAHAALRALDRLAGWRCLGCPVTPGLDAHGAPCGACNGTGSVDRRPERAAAQADVGPA